jgi:hypothetical protein
MKNILYAFFLIASVFALNGCGGARSGGGAALAPGEVAKLSDFNANQFNYKVYVRGMSKVARNTLAWQDPDSHLGDFHFIKIEGPTDKYLPVNANFAHKSTVESFGRSFKSYLDLKQKSSGKSLRVVVAVVECNPGSRAARYWVGMGAGKAAGTVVIEVYEPGRNTPSLKIYARDTASMGGFGGDSISMMNSIFEAIANRTTTILEGRIDVAKAGRTGKEI